MNDAQMKLAALAVFKSLYDNQKDIYSVLWEFARHSIGKRSLTQISGEQLRDILVEDYSFDNIPVAVVRTMIRKQPEKNLKRLSDGGFMVMPEFRRQLASLEENVEIEEEQARFQALVDELSQYIQDETKQEIDTDRIMSALQGFLLDELTTGDLTNEINTFILKKEQENESDFRNALNQIKEGFILYSGICWCGELNELGHWRYPMTLYFDMDIIFYLAGYSGELYQTMFCELYQLVKEINADAARHNKGRLISLRYFSEVRQQIDHFFDIAEKIVENKRTLDPSEPAMVYIVDHCDTPSDVMAMRSDLDSLLINMAIIEDNQSFYEDEKNYVNNVESEELIEKYTSERDSRDKVERYLKKINYICLLREGHISTNFEQCEYIMVTRNRLCAQLDKDADTRLKQQYRRVISPEVLTGQFWFKMNKGFAQEHMLMSIDVLAQAKMIMARQINANIAECYRKIKRDYEQGNITEEQAIRQCATFREYCVSPENVTTEILAETCVLAENSVKDMMLQQEVQASREKQTALENEELKKSNEELQQYVIEKQQQVEAEIAASVEKDKKIEEQDLLIIEQKSKLAATEQNLSDKDREIEELKREKRERQEQEQLRRKRIKLVLLGVLAVVLLGVLVFLGYQLYYDSKLAKVIIELVAVVAELLTIAEIIKTGKSK